MCRRIQLRSQSLLLKSLPNLSSVRLMFRKLSLKRSLRWCRRRLFPHLFDSIVALTFRRVPSRISWSWSLFLPLFLSLFVLFKFFIFRNSLSKSLRFLQVSFLNLYDLFVLLTFRKLWRSLAWRSLAPWSLAPWSLAQRNWAWRKLAQRSWAWRKLAQRSWTPWSSASSCLYPSLPLLTIRRIKVENL